MARGKEHVWRVEKKMAEAYAGRNTLCSRWVCFGSTIGPASQPSIRIRIRTHMHEVQAAAGAAAASSWLE